MDNVVTILSAVQDVLPEVPTKVSEIPLLSFHPAIRLVSLTLNPMLPRIHFAVTMFHPSYPASQLTPSHKHNHIDAEARRCTLSRYVFGLPAIL